MAPPLPNRPRPLHLWHLTSLDAPTVAVTWVLAFAWAASEPPANIHLPRWVPVLLALVTWSVYIADRLLDALRANRLGHQPVPNFEVPGPWSLSPRHTFHWRHRYLFVATAVTAALTACAIVLHNMPLAARERNSLLAAAALVYFSAVHNPWHPKLKFPKELLVGILFTLACALPTLTRMTTGQIALAAPILAFIALAWLNCRSIEIWESASSRSMLLPAIGIAVATILLAVANHHHPRPALLLLTAAISAALLALLDLYERRLHPTTLRALADLVLLTPLLLFFLN